MSSRTPLDSHGSKSSRHGPSAPTPPPPLSAEDALSGPSTPTDDTPTIISRKAPAQPANGVAAGVNIRGLRLAHFELIEPIGVGGMAAVLRARDTQLDRLVALKILPQEMAADPENIRRFHQEARSAAKLDHENIARVFYCGEDQRLHFIAFEFVEGDNLRTVLDRRGRLPVGEAIHYLLQVAAGLAHAARRGVVHRDIKPSNIIITPNGRAKLVDMGLARSLEPRSDNDLTQSGVTLGTFDYISPEQALEPRDADVRSDIYSLGCTFYHVLTGRPPVPEGTAAKKLHHHQHVNPPDPREIVPNLPAEVILVLERMLAKSPRDRYQSPEELVHQLLLVARKLGAAPEVPEGVLTVETSLPAHHHGRPLLWAVIAAAAVVLLVFFVDLTPSSTPTRSSPAHNAENGDSRPLGKGAQGLAKSADDGQASTAGEKPVPERVYTAPEEPTADHLRQWLAQNRDAQAVRLRLAGDLDLSPRDGQMVAGLVIQASQKVVIEPRDKGARPTLRLTYNVGWTREAMVALAVTSKESSIEGVRVLLDARESEVSMTALQIREGTTHTVRRCEFVQAGRAPHVAGANSAPTQGDRRMASVVVRASRSRPVVNLTECAFLGFGKLARTTEKEDARESLLAIETGGQDAVVRQGPVRLKAENCVFGPHLAAFRLERSPGDAAETLTVRHCTVLLGPKPSAAFELTAGVAGPLVVSHCLFSRMPGEAEAGAVLLNQSDDHPLVAFQGRDNCYHDLDGFWAVRGNWQAAGCGDFRRKIAAVQGGQDAFSRVLRSSPWQQPPARQAELLEGAQPQLAQAFAVSLLHAGLRKQDQPGVMVVGAVNLLGEAWLPEKLPALDEKAPPPPQVLVVEKDEAPAATAGDNAYGVYPKLVLAISSARPGDTILIRHNGELKIDPVQLNTKSLSNLTIKPARKFRPVLVLGETDDPDMALFRVLDGRLRLEGLELRLNNPDMSPFKTQTVVTLVGNGECVLKDCLVTLKREGTASVALASVVDPGKVMRLDMAPARDAKDGPRLSLENCVVRGDGDLFWARASRPCAVDVKGSMAALSGSGVNVEVSGDGTAAAGKVKVNFSQTTAYLGSPLMRLNAEKGPQGVVPVSFKAANCLFVPSGEVKSLISLEGPDADDRTLSEKFTWNGGPNAYGAYTSLLTRQRSDDPPTPVGAEKWKMTQSREETSTFGVKLAAQPPVEQSFHEMRPEQFAPPESVREMGATLTKLPRFAARR